MVDKLHLSKTVVIFICDTIRIQTEPHLVFLGLPRKP